MIGELEVENQINSMRNAMGGKDYNMAIRIGLLLYNKYNNKISNNNKLIISYNLALSYKKNNMPNEALSFLNIASKCVDENSQGYFQILWLMNNCEIELKIDEKKEILKRFNDCLIFYKFIKDRQMTAQILYSIAKYKNYRHSMFRCFKMVVKESDSIIPIFVDYDIRAEVRGVLDDFEKIDVNLYKLAKAYLKTKIVSIDSIR